MKPTTTRRRRRRNRTTSRDNVKERGNRTASRREGIGQGQGEEKEGIEDDSVGGWFFFGGFVDLLYMSSREMAKRSVESLNLSGIVSSDYVLAQQEIESVLIRNINEIFSSKSSVNCERISQVVPLIQDLVDKVEAAERKLRIANDKIVDLELSGVVVASNRDELSSAYILHSQLQRREAEMAQAVGEIESLTEQLEIARSEDQAERNRLISLVASKTHEVDDLRVDRDRLANVVGDLKTDRDRLANIVGDLKTDRDRLVHSVSTKTDEVDELKRLAVRPETAQAAPSDDQAGVIRELEEELELMTREARRKKELETQIIFLKNQLSEYQKKHTMPGLAGIQDKVELSSMQDECARQRRRIAELEKIVDQTKGEADLVKTRLKEVELTVHSRSETIRKLESQNGELRIVAAEREELIKAIENVSIEADRLQVVSSELGSQVHRLGNDKLELSTQIDRLIDEIEELETANVSRSKRVVELEQMIAGEHATKKKISDVEQALAISEVNREALQTELRAAQQQQRRPVQDDGILDEIYSSVRSVRDALSKELIGKSKEIEILSTCLGEKERIIATLQQQILNQLTQEDVIPAEAVLVDSSEDPASLQEIDIACAELKSAIIAAGWPLDNGQEDLGSLVGLVKANIIAMDDVFSGQLREMALDVEYLRAQLETERMAAEDARQSLTSEIDRVRRTVVEETSKRKLLQESALELAEKTTVLWNKYRAGGAPTNLTLPPFPPKSTN